MRLGPNSEPCDQPMDANLWVWLGITREITLHSSVVTYSTAFKTRHYVSTYQKILIYICTTGPKWPWWRDRQSWVQDNGALPSSNVPYRVCSSQAQIPFHGSTERREHSTSLAHRVIMRENAHGRSSWDKWQWQCWAPWQAQGCVPPLLHVEIC